MDIVGHKQFMQEGRFFSHTLDINYFKAIKACFSGRGSLEHAGDIPSIFLVVFIFFL